MQLIVITVRFVNHCICNGNCKCNDHQQSQPMHYQLCYARVVKDVLMWKWNTTTLLSSLPPCLPADNLVQRSVERVFLIRIPLDFVCEAVEFFGHVKELECRDIRDPQQVCLCIVYIHTLVQLNLGEILPAVLIMHCFPQFMPIFSLHATVPQNDVWVSLFSPHRKNC